MTEPIELFKKILDLGLSKYLDGDAYGADISDFKCKASNIYIMFELKNDSVFIGFNDKPIPLIQGDITHNKIVNNLLECLELSHGKPKGEAYLNVLKFYCESVKIFKDNKIKISILSDIDMIIATLYGFGLRKQTIEILKSDIPI